MPWFLALAVAAFVAMGCSSDSGAAGDATQGVDTVGEVTIPDAAESDTATPDGGKHDDTEAETTEPCSEPCDDGDPCTTDDRCEDGVCTGDTKSCDDENPCTSDECDSETGECVYEPATGTCDDGDPCTENDRCEGGECTGDGLTCNDDNDCTLDICDSATGECANTPQPGESCDDGDPCTENDSCGEDAMCAGTLKTCDDGIDCTQDTCGEDGECVHTPDSKNCDDETPCTAETCDPTAGCLHWGSYAAVPTLDGAVSDWAAATTVAENAIFSDWTGAELSRLSASVGPAALYLALRGSVTSNQAWLIFLDLDFGTQSGVRDLATLSGSGADLDLAASVPVAIDIPGFGVDFLIGSIGPLSVNGTANRVGCRAVAEDGTLSDVACQVVDAQGGSVEIAILWSNLYPSELPTEDNGVAGFAVIGNEDGYDISNQMLPQQEGDDIETLFHFAAVPGDSVCLAPFCGNGVVEEGEDCDENTPQCVDCVLPPPGGMVRIPAGDFIMGRDSAFLDDPSSPAHLVTLDAYFIDRYEVTNAEFAAFLEANGSPYDANQRLLYPCGPSSLIDCGLQGDYTPQPGLEDHPVSEVAWIGAFRYCEWVGKRLPTEAEWEKAARGTDELLYPWGNDFDGDLLNCIAEQCDGVGSCWDVCTDGFARTAPIGYFGGNASPYGVYDMAGNVWEWTNDWYDPGYYSISPQHNPRGPCADQLTCLTADSHVARGGGWDDEETRTTTVFRYPAAGCFDPDRGFRCAQDAGE